MPPGTDVQNGDETDIDRDLQNDLQQQMPLVIHGQGREYAHANQIQDADFPIMKIGLGPKSLAAIDREIKKQNECDYNPGGIECLQRFP